MPSSKEIKQQNVAFEEQRDLLGEISGYIELAAASAQDMTNNLQGALSIFQQIENSADDVADSTEEAADNTGKMTTFAKRAQVELKKLGSSLVNAAKSVASTMASAFGDIADILQNVLSLSIVGTFGALFTSIITQFQYEFKQVVNELGIGFKVVGTEADNANQKFEKLRYNIVEAGLEFKDVVGSSRILADNFGVGVSTSANLSFNIADGAKALGVQTSTMATLVGQFSLVGDISKEQSHLLSEQIGLLAAQNDVAPAAVLEDMAGSTEEMALFSKGGIKNFAKTAIEARKLGMSVKDVANTLKGMLNFEDSLNKELQASVMLGKNINLNEARRLTFAGDTAGAFQAIANELGDVDLGSLDPLTLQSVADAAGMSTEQLLKMSKGAEEMGGVDMGEEALSAQDVAALRARDTLTDMEKVMADMSNITKDLAATFGGPLVEGLGDFAKMMKDFFTAEKLEELKKKFKDFIDTIKGYITNGQWGELGKYIGGLLWEGMKAAWNVVWPVTKGLVNAAFTELGDSTAGAFLKAGGLLYAAGGKGPLAMLGKGMKALVTGPMKLAGLASKKLKKTFGFGKVFDENAKRWRKSTGQFTKAPKGAVVMKKVMDSKFGKTVKNVAKGFKAAGKPAVKFFSTFGRLGKAVPVLGQALTIFDGVSGALKSYDKDAGIAKNALNMLGGAAMGVTDGLVKSVTDISDYLFGTELTAGYENMKTKISSAFKSSKDAVVGFFSGAKKGIAEKLSGVGKAISEKFSDAKDLIAEKLGNMGEAVKTAWGKTTDWFGEQKNNIVEFFTAGEDGKNLGDNISDTLSGIYTKMGDAWEGTTEWFGDQKTAIMDYFGTEGTLGNKIANAFNGVKEGVKTAWDNTTEFFSTAKDSIVDTFNNVSTDIGNKFDAGKDWISGKFDEAKKYAASAKDGIANKFADMGGAIKEKAGDIGQGIKDAFQKAGSFLSDMFDFSGADLSDLTASAKKMAKSVRDILFWPFNQVKKMFNKFIGAISNYSLIDPFTVYIPFYGDVGFDGVKLPNLDHWKMKSPVAQDFIMRPGEEAQRFSPSDNIIGYKGSLVDLAPVVEAGREQTHKNSEENHEIMQLLQRQNAILEAILSNGIPVTKGI